MIVGLVLAVSVLVAGVYLRNRSDKAPLTRDELRRMRQYYDRAHREQVLPFE